MIDINILRDDPARVRGLCEKRGLPVNVDELLACDAQWRALQTQIQHVRHAQKKASAAGDIEQAIILKRQADALQQQFQDVDQQRRHALDGLPNLLAPDTPGGVSDAQNVEIQRWGTPRNVDFVPQTHDALGIALGILDIKRATRICGRGFYYWIGDGARLMAAVYRLAEDFLMERGFTPMRTPLLTQDISFYGTGYLPFSQDDLFRLKEHDLALIGTSEQTMVAYHHDEVLEERVLPLCYTAYSPCFRSEAGGAGRMTRGAFRMHQFHKQEQIVFCAPEDSERWHGICQQNAQDFVELLDIPYRTVRVCAGDMGAPGYKKYDIEAWFPGFDAYRETHSNTNLLDFQTRRLNIQAVIGKRRVFPHTISATLATDRLILALMENNQDKQGHIRIPQALRAYMGGHMEISQRGVP